MKQHITLYDNTRISEFKVCPRKFYWRHVRDFAPDGKSVALIFGGSWHAALDALYTNYRDLYGPQHDSVLAAAYEAFISKWMEEGLPHPSELDIDQLADMSPRTPQIAKEMLYAYPEARRHIFTDPSFELIAVEKPFAVPLDPNDESKWYVGRLDKVIKWRGKYLVIEHKTSTSYKKGGPFRADFVDSFSLSSQIDGYLFGLRALYRDLAAGVWVDAALVHKEIHDGFKFIPVDRKGEHIDAWLYDTHSYIDQIEGNLEVVREGNLADAPYMAAFPKNTASCMQFNSQCAFADLCKTLANPAQEDAPPLGYHVERWSPVSELRLSELGFSVDVLQHDKENNP